MHNMNEQFLNFNNPSVPPCECSKNVICEEPLTHQCSRRHINSAVLTYRIYCLNICISAMHLLNLKSNLKNLEFK